MKGSRLEPLLQAKPETLLGKVRARKPGGAKGSAVACCTLVKLSVTSGEEPFGPSSLCSQPLMATTFSRSLSEPSVPFGQADAPPGSPTSRQCRIRQAPGGSHGPFLTRRGGGSCWGSQRIRAGQLLLTFLSAAFLSQVLFALVKGEFSREAETLFTFRFDQL